jgi:hypothetical protein
MVYELRIYYMHPGQMQAIHDRFANATLEIFAKNALKVIEFWEDIDPAHNRLYYVMEHKDMDSRNKNFENFQKDPEWLLVKNESEKDGPIVERIEIIFLKNVPYFSGRSQQ